MKVRESILLGELLRPLTKKNALYIDVRKIFTDIDGVIIDKLAIPQNLNTSFPFWMFGKWDACGGYQIGNKICPAPIKQNPTGMQYLYTFVFGISQIPFFASGFSIVQNFLKVGDIIHVFTDSYNAPNYFCFIVQSNQFASISSIIENTSAEEKINITSCVFKFGDNNQLDEVIHLTYNDVIGDLKDDTIVPRSYFQVDNANQAGYISVILPLKFIVNQYIELSSYITAENDDINFSFIIQQPKNN